MNNSDLRKYAEQLVAPRTRWLAIIAGCVSGLAGSLPFGPLFSLEPAILIFGAVLQCRSPRPGRWLMWLGAFVLTVHVVVFLGPAVLAVLSPKQLLAPYYDQNLLIFFLLSLASLGLVGWCDVALIVDAVRSANASPPADQGFPRTADLIVGMFALCLMAGAVWWVLASFYPLRRYHRVDILLFAAAFAVPVAAFNVATVAHAVKMYRDHHSQGNL